MGKEGALVPAGKISDGGNLAVRAPEFSDRKVSKNLIPFNVPKY